MRITKRRNLLLLRILFILGSILLLFFYWHLNEFASPFRPDIVYTVSHIESTKSLLHDHDCSNSTSALLVICISAPHHFEQRSAIRETWGQSAKKLGINLFFLMGLTDDTTTQESINCENFRNGDILQAKFHDSYYNLTLKSLSMLHWVAQKQYQCSSVKYVLKVDDDMFMNIPEIANFVEGHSQTSNQEAFIGFLATGFRPVRFKLNKYYCPYFLYEESIFPDFVNGPAYLFPANYAQSLFDSAAEEPERILFLEDVFVTGILAEKLDIPRIGHESFVNDKVEVNKENFDTIWSSHKVGPKEIRKRWASIYGNGEDCWLRYFC